MKKRVKIFFATMLIFSIISVNAYAYSIMFGTMNFITNQYSLTIAYEQFGTRNHTTAVNNARIAWNESAANIYVESRNPNTGENIVVDSKDFGNVDWYGYCSAPYFLTPNTSFIKINDYYYNDYSSHTSELIAHEMGHSFRLDDISDDTVLMTNVGFKGSSNPEQDDVNGVNSNYK